MKRNILLLFTFFACITVQGQTPVRLVDLRSEHLDRPIGLDNPVPRLSWRMEDGRQGAVQTSWRIVVDEDSLNVVNGCGRMWDSGKNDSRNQLVAYAGKKLQPFTRYYWKVICSDMEYKETASPVSYFETGMMGMQHWQGAWIGDGKDIHYGPAPYFRKEFKTGKKVKSARAYIAAAGLYELYINGEKVGDHCLAPLYTRFDRRNLYVAYDVTSQLQNGDNAIGVLLGNGWYNHQSKAVWDFDRAPWRNRPAFCLDLRITYTDGSVETIPTDLSWRTASGAITFNSIYTGEHYDARLEQKGWSTPEFDDSKWRGVAYRSVPSSNVTAQQVHPIRNVKIFPAVSFRKVDEKTYIYDFGQNMSGVTCIHVSGERGTEVRIKHGERLHPNGRLDLSNIDVYFRGDKEKDPFQTDILILSGEEDEFMPRFNYKGFRYVEVVADKPIELDQNSLIAYFMHSDVPAVGSLESSSPLIGKLLHAAKLYHDYYYAYWQQKPSEFPGLERQFIFQDLRYSRVFEQIGKRFDDFSPNPLYEIGFERVPGRSFRIDGNNQVDSLIAGMKKTAVRFEEVSRHCEDFLKSLPKQNQRFFRDNLAAPCHYMAALSHSLYHFVSAYKEKDRGKRTEHLEVAIQELEEARDALYETQEGVFSTWYIGDSMNGKFNIPQQLKLLNKLHKEF